MLNNIQNLANRRTPSPNKMLSDPATGSESRISPNYVPPMPVNPEGLTLIRANLISLWVEAVLFGVFLVLFTAALYILLYVKRGENVRMNKARAAASVMMILLITGVSRRFSNLSNRKLTLQVAQHVVCDLLRAIKAFTTPTQPDVIYVNIHANLQYAKAVMYYTLSLVGCCYCRSYLTC